MYQHQERYNYGCINYKLKLGGNFHREGAKHNDTLSR